MPKGAGSYEDSFECCPGYERWCSPLGHVHKTLFTEPKRGECCGPVAKPCSWPGQRSSASIPGPGACLWEEVFLLTCWDTSHPLCFDATYSSQIPSGLKSWLPVLTCEAWLASIANHAGAATVTSAFWGHLQASLRGKPGCPVLCALPHISLLAVTSP